jgi:hypothetical protein
MTKMTSIFIVSLIAMAVVFDVHANVASKTYVDSRETATKTWVGDQGYIKSADVSGKEDVRNKITTDNMVNVDVADNDTDYPSVGAMANYVETGLSGKEDKSNLTDNLNDGATISSTKYASTRTIKQYIAQESAKKQKVLSGPAGQVLVYTGTEGSIGTLALGTLATRSSVGTRQLVDSGIQTIDVADAAITKEKLAASVQTSLGKADTALQVGANISGLTNDSGYLTTDDMIPYATDTFVYQKEAEEIARADAAYATKAQGALADTAVQPAAITNMEITTNKTIDVATDGASDVKYPSAKAVKTYADSTVSKVRIGSAGTAFANMWIE